MIHGIDDDDDKAGSIVDVLNIQNYPVSYYCFLMEIKSVQFGSKWNLLILYFYHS